MAPKGYRNVLFGGQTLTSASDGGYQREGQVGAANIFGGAPQQGRVPQQVTAQQPTFAQLQAQGVARFAPPSASLKTSPGETTGQMGAPPAWSVTGGSQAYDAFGNPVSANFGWATFDQSQSAPMTPEERALNAKLQSGDQGLMNEYKQKYGAGWLQQWQADQERLLARSVNQTATSEQMGTLGRMSGADAWKVMSNDLKYLNAMRAMTPDQRQAFLDQWQPGSYDRQLLEGSLAAQGITVASGDTGQRWDGATKDYISSSLRSSTGIDGLKGTDITGGKSATTPTFVANSDQRVAGGSGGIPSLPDYASLNISDSDLLSRVNALLGRSGSLSVGAPKISPVGGITAPTMELAAQGPAATQALQAQYLQALQDAIATPSRYDLPTFTKIRDAALADIQAQYGEQQRQQAAQLAARGLSASSIAARAGESLGERQARAVADLNAQLLQQAATTQAADRAAALQAAQTGMTQVAAQQLDRFNALQNQYANALSEGRLQEALRIQTEQQNIQTGLQGLQAVLGQNLGVAQLQQGGALGAASLSLQERKMLMDLLQAIYSAQSTNSQTGNTQTNTGTGTGVGTGGGGTGTGSGSGSGGTGNPQF